VRRRTIALVAALCVVAAGCGGGDGGGRLSRDDYVSKADAICLATVQKRQALSAPTTLAGIPRYVDRALPLLDAARSDLRALRPPAELEDKVAAWLAAIGEERDALADLRSAAKEKNGAKVRAIGSQGVAIEQRARARARAIGLVDCANS
jgi:hypothetical protein